MEPQKLRKTNINEINEIDKIYIQGALHKLQSIALVSSNDTERALEYNDQVEYWLNDLQQKFNQLCNTSAQISGSKKTRVGISEHKLAAECTIANTRSFREPPECLRRAIHLLSSGGILAKTSLDPAHRSHEQVGFIVKCAQKLQKILMNLHRQHETLVYRTIKLHQLYFTALDTMFQERYTHFQNLVRTLHNQKLLSERQINTAHQLDQDTWCNRAQSFWTDLLSWWGVVLQSQMADTLVLADLIKQTKNKQPGHEEEEGEGKVEKDPLGGERRNQYVGAPVIFNETLYDELKEVEAKSDHLFHQLDRYQRSCGYETEIDDNNNDNDNDDDGNVARVSASTGRTGLKEAKKTTTTTAMKTKIPIMLHGDDNNDNKGNDGNDHKSEIEKFVYQQQQGQRKNMFETNGKDDESNNARNIGMEDFEMIAINHLKSTRDNKEMKPVVQDNDNNNNDDNDNDNDNDKEDGDGDQPDEPDDTVTNTNHNIGIIILDELNDTLKRWDYLIKPHIRLIGQQRKYYQDTFTRVEEVCRRQSAKVSRAQGLVIKIERNQGKLYKQVSTTRLTNKQIEENKAIQAQLVAARQVWEHEQAVLHTQITLYDQAKSLNDAAQTPRPANMVGNIRTYYRQLATQAKDLTLGYRQKKNQNTDDFYRKVEQLLAYELMAFQKSCFALQQDRKQIEEQKIWQGYFEQFSLRKVEAVELEAHIIRSMFQAIQFSDITMPLSELSEALQGITEVLSQQQWRLRQALRYQFLLKYVKQCKSVLNQSSKQALPSSLLSSSSSSSSLSSAEKNTKMAK